MEIKVTAIFISPCTGKTIQQTIISTISTPASVLVGVNSQVVIN